MYRTLMNFLLSPLDIEEMDMPTYSTPKNSLSTFDEEDNTYIKIVNLPDNIDAKSVNVECDEDERTLTIEYSYSSKNFSHSSKSVEMLPADADMDSISARVDSNVLTVIIDKLPEPVKDKCEEMVEENTPVIIDVKRKKK